MADRNPEAAVPGPIVDREGTVLGEHRGLAHYTVGQRRGLRLGGPGGPWFVLRLRPSSNELVVGSEEALWVRECEIVDLRLVGMQPRRQFSAAVCTRYRGTTTPACIEMDGDRADVRFERPHRAPTPGQSAVFYLGARLLGGGVIAPAQA